MNADHQVSIVWVNSEYRADMCSKFLFRIYFVEYV